ncbi:MAG: photosystem I reaction center protein subunit XI, partial [Synechococcaceae cyanobacterium SM2_3_1]|nr:photosystem I reaction center protein subunit XI [Synechococcaceae cyanobacterium SM2_3_1]
LMTMALQIYGYVTELKDTPVGDSEGWSAFAGGFLIGGVGGAVVAYLLLANSELVLSGFNLAL